MLVLKTENLIKRYGDFLAVDHINLELQQGEILGLLGPNGAGKSTFINAITTIIPFDSGNVEIFGKEIKKNLKTIKPLIGIVPQELSLYNDLTAQDNVSFFASLYGFRGLELKKQVKQALEFTGLWDRRGDKPKKFSGGMKRRLNIACAIAHKPRLIIMDEPTVGIDPQSRNHILDSVRQLNQEGATIIYTTHYMEEVEALCSRIEIIDQGKVIVKGKINELKEMITNEHSMVFDLTGVNFTMVESIKRINGIVEAFWDQRSLTVVSKQKNIDEIIQQIQAQGGIIESVNMNQCTLEDVFLTLTGRTLRD